MKKKTKLTANCIDNGTDAASPYLTPAQVRAANARNRRYVASLAQSPKELTADFIADLLRAFDDDSNPIEWVRVKRGGVVEYLVEGEIVTLKVMSIKKAK